MASVLDIVRGISSVVANTYDGALDENGEPIKIGLKREEGDPIIDSRVMDGFKVQFQGPFLKVMYNSEMRIKDVHERNRFESEIESTIGDIVSFIKKEYKKTTGDSLSLTESGEAEILVQNISRLRTWVQANRMYKIGGMPDVLEMKQPSEDNLDDAVKKWLGLNGNRKRATGTGWLGNDRYPDSKDAENVKGKRDDEPR
jgi:hypothetical protein